MLFLRFQDALAGERWPEALSFCSERVRAKAAQWPSPKVFFQETLPMDLLLAESFGYWTLKFGPGGSLDSSDEANLYGLFVNLTEPEAKPVLQWYWAIYETNNAWVVDYPPVKMTEYVAEKTRAIRAREDRLEEIRRSLEPKIRGIQTRLTATSRKFAVGAPLLFRLELVNHSSTPVQYTDSGTAFAPLTVRDKKGQPLASTPLALQIMVKHGEIAPGATVVLADGIDLNRHYAIAKRGKYSVQFSGADLQVGQSFPPQEPGLFGENEMARLGEFVAVTNKFPSNIISISVTGRNQR